jgi:hypothetical protein
MYGNLINKVEETIVNGFRGNFCPLKKILENKSINNFMTDMLVYNKSLEKEYRLNYYNKTDEFYLYLKDMCEKLKEYPKDGNPNRNDMLKSFVENMNNIIKEIRAEFNEHDSISKCFYKGILLPFDDNVHTSDEYNSLVI